GLPPAAPLGNAAGVVAAGGFRPGFLPPPPGGGRPFRLAPAPRPAPGPGGAAPPPAGGRGPPPPRGPRARPGRARGHGRAGGAAASPEKRAGQYTALGIVAATTVLAVAVLLSGAGLGLGLAALAVLGCLLWLVRGYLPDLTAGLQLRAHKVRELYFNGTPWQV